MTKWVFPVLGIALLAGLAACSKTNLIDGIYASAKNGTETEQNTAFIILSNLALTGKDIQKITHDYAQEKNARKKFLYEYVLVRRTQENKYKDLFIKSAAGNLNLLVMNKSDWVSISSPFYDLLAYYANDNDLALLVMLKLIDKVDAEIATLHAINMKRLYTQNSQRVERSLNKAGISLADFKKFISEAAE